MPGVGSGGVDSSGICLSPSTGDPLQHSCSPQQICEQHLNLMMEDQVESGGAMPESCLRAFAADQHNPSLHQFGFSRDQKARTGVKGTPS